MRGDQLGREWRIIGATEAYLNRLTLIDIAKREESFKRAINRHPDPLSAAGSPHYAERVGRARNPVLVDNFKLKILPLLSPKQAKHTLRDYQRIINILQLFGRRASWVMEALERRSTLNDDSEIMHYDYHGESESLIPEIEVGRGETQAGESKKQQTSRINGSSKRAKMGL